MPTQTKSSGSSNPFGTGGTTVNVIPKGNGSSQLADSSLVDDGAGNITIPGKIANTGQIVISQLATPAAPSLVITGGVGTNYSYKVVAKVGTAVTAASAAGSTAAGPTTLDGTHFIDVNWTAIVGATSYDIYRTVGGATQGKVANVLAPLLTVRDNALVGDASTAPVANTTGGLVSASLTEVPGTNLTSIVPLVTTAAGTAALPAIGVGATNLGFFKSGALIGVGIGSGIWAAFSNTLPGGVVTYNGGAFAWSSTGAADGAPDTWIRRKSAANFALGTTDVNGVPVDQTISVQNAITGTNLPGGHFTIDAPLGTGTGAAAKTSINRALMGASGGTAQTSANALAVGQSKTLSNTSATAQTIATITLGSNAGGGCAGTFTLVATDGTNFDSETQSFNVSFVNKAGAVTVGTPAITPSTAANNSGSATLGITAVANGNNIDIKVTPVFGTIVPTTVTLYPVISHSTNTVTFV